VCADEEVDGGGRRREEKKEKREKKERGDGEASGKQIFLYNYHHIFNEMVEGKARELREITI